jgi:hypothetical protein
VVREDLGDWGVFYGPFCKKIATRDKGTLNMEKEFLHKKERRGVRSDIRQEK